MTHPRLAAFDLDGTLAPSKRHIDPHMGDLVARLMARMPVAVLSGGSLEQFRRQLLDGLPADAPLGRLYLFPTNAATCLAYRDGEWRPEYDNSFSAQERQRIMDAFKESLAEAGFVMPPRVWGTQLEDRGGQVTFSALGQEAPLEEKQSYDPDRTIRTPIAETLRRRLPDLSIGVNAATSIDVTPHGVDKAYGIVRLSELTGIPVSDMLYMGDALQEGGNDAVVIKTGIQTHAVSGPDETAQAIEELLRYPATGV